ncbi:MAG TPA: Gfo/Idh/MocA family oxidoreductase, partial [Solirubrobacterales bacterium]|nr:Gfo/Idh/MocA family oxidoreductase [Solirubrobacterales bacterium]
HAPLIAATPGLKVSAVVTGNPERQAAARRAYPGASVVSNPDEVFGRAEDHDFVVVAAPNDVHVTLGRNSLDAGLPTVVDKPLAPTAGEARSLVEHAEELGVLITAYMNRRWDSDLLTLRRLLEEGRLGEVLRYESRFERWRPTLSETKSWRERSSPSAGGGILLDLGSHLVDQARLLFGEPEHVYAEIADRRGGGSDDDAFVALHHGSGVWSHLWMSLLAASPGPRLRVLGDRAAYVVAEVDGQEAALVAGARPGDDADWGAEPREKWGQLVNERGSEPVPSERGDWPRFYLLLERALREGSPPPVDPWDAVAGLEILDAARRSEASGTVVSLPD